MKNKPKPKPKVTNHLRVSDITCLLTRQGMAYLGLVADAYLRRIVGHRVHPSWHTAGCLAALARVVRGAGGRARRDSSTILTGAVSTPPMPTRRP